MHRYLRRGGRLALFLAALLALYTLLLLAAYSFPDEWIRENVTAATNVLIEEGNMPGGYATYFWHSGFGIADNVTDRVIYEGLLKNGRNVVDAAMRTDYARYWHGYAVLLRPMSIMLSIINIRYLNMMAVMGLLVLCCWHCRARLGARTALCFWVALAMGFVLLAPFCQQYMPVTLLTLLACCVLLGGWPRIRRFLPESFMLLGSVVCFFGFSHLSRSGAGISSGMLPAAYAAGGRQPRAAVEARAAAAHAMDGGLQPDVAWKSSHRHASYRTECYGRCFAPGGLSDGRLL